MCVSKPCHGGGRIDSHGDSPSVCQSIKEANGDSVYRRLEKRGFKFKKQKSFWDRFIGYLF